ncbi:bactofilin [Paenibacillus doosanensis]|uniref:Polymer-forming cytoskeletal n=1 Tax=Paenibacillus konkukensis TaxID=2020716 RepID=A0ABY4RKA8_9BACL|nr:MULTISPECIES: bactofilin [Paenibacillus]MCS7462219.1 bactofilin [Paenibacillus doosanensis]UQZ82917.1 Polymer-forming cytoskeletal [Paenibacillus konkukensis]
MANAIRHKLVLAGTGSASGGAYDDVKITGEGQIIGNLDCVDFKVYGTSRMEGNVKARRFRIFGTSVVVGSAETDEAHIYGTLDIGGDMSVRQLKLHGRSDIGGTLTGDRLYIGGEALVQQDCEAETFVAKGFFTIGGLLNADHIDIRLFGPCRAREIGGSSINVKRTGLAYNLHRLFHSKASAAQDHLAADIIEGDRIYLEYTKAAIVRGSFVSIGPGCEIDCVEYTEHFEQADGSVVRQHGKV